MMIFRWAIILLFGISTFEVNGQESTITLSGYVKDAETGEDLIAATIYIPQITSGVTTNVYGFYSLTLEAGNYDLIVSYVGYEDERLQINLSENTEMNVELSFKSTVMNEIVVTAESENKNVEEVSMSRIDLDMTQIKKLPSFMGEVDVIKALQLLPGVATVGEGTSGFYVRGGNVDQNLLILDEAPVYNASHLLGFFSVFNPDAIKDIQFYKGAMPAEYGGRLSSVVDIRMKDGNSKRIAGTAGIGSIASRLTLEAPLGDKGSAMIAARRTYADLFMKLSPDTSIAKSRLYFYDFNGKINYKFGDKDRLFLSGYLGRDVFSQHRDFQTDYGNKTATLRWNHLFSQKLFSNLTIYASDYNYEIGEDDPKEGFSATSRLKDYGLKYDFGMFPNPSSTIKFGVSSTYHILEPENVQSTSEDGIFNNFKIEDNKSIESAAYIAHEYAVNSKLKINYGLRFSLLHNVGPRTLYNYNADYTFKDSSSVKKGEIYNTNSNFEPRIGLRYQIDKTSSIKLSYNRTAQYIHLASNSTSASPLDVWFLSSQHVKPQLANQYAAGYFRNFKKGGIEASLELYYKTFENAIDFKDHARLILNQQLEGELRFGIGRSYGAELLVKKNTGKLTGWISYTLSKSEKKIDQINDGEWYNAKYDRVHDISLVGTYELSKRFDLGAAWVFKTGTAITLPTGKYQFHGRTVPIYSERNGARMPAYHRLDLSATYKHKKKLFGMEQMTNLSIYNAYLRHNPYSINFKSEGDGVEAAVNAEKTYLFSIIPSVTYNLKF